MATGGKVPLPPAAALGLGLPSSVAAAAAAANGLLTGASAAAAAAAAAAGRSGRGSGRAGAAAGSGAGGAAASSSAVSGGGGAGSSSSSSSGLLPGTAAVLEPLESVEATLAALLADMGGALCSLQAGAMFGGHACSVDPVGHCIKPADKRLVVRCTLGCAFNFHLPCWKVGRREGAGGERGRAGA